MVLNGSEIMAIGLLIILQAWVLSLMFRTIVYNYKNSTKKESFIVDPNLNVLYNEYFNHSQYLPYTTSFLDKMRKHTKYASIYNYSCLDGCTIDNEKHDIDWICKDPDVSISKQVHSDKCIYDTDCRGCTEHWLSNTDFIF